MNVFQTLIWHHWRRTRAWLPLPLMLMAAWNLSMALLAHTEPFKTNTPVALFAAIGNLYLLCIGAYCFVGNLASDEQNAGMPAYAKCLPVRNRTWALSYVVCFGLALAALAAAATMVDVVAYPTGAPRSLFIHPPVDYQPPAGLVRIRDTDLFPVWKRPLPLVAVSYFCFSILLAISAIKTVPLRVLLQTLLLGSLPGGVFSLMVIGRFGPTVLALWAGLLTAGMAITWVSVGWARRGVCESRILEAITRQESRLDRRQPFASPARALAWYDWMTFSRYLVYGAAPLALLCGLGELAERQQIVTGMGVVPAAALASLYLAHRLYHGDKPQFDGYLTTLPVTVERLARSRMRSVSKSVVAAWLVAVLIEIVILSALMVDEYDAPDLDQTILTTVLAAWVLVWVTGPLIYPAIGIWILAIAVHAATVYSSAESAQSNSAGVPIILLGISALIAAAAVWLVWLARRRGWWRGWSKWSFLSTWLISAVIVLATLLWLSNESRAFQGTPFVAYPLALLLCAIPASPFLGLPLAIGRYRNR